MFYLNSPPKTHANIEAANHGHWSHIKENNITVLVFAYTGCKLSHRMDKSQLAIPHNYKKVVEAVERCHHIYPLIWSLVHFGFLEYLKRFSYKSQHRKPRLYVMQDLQMKLYCDAKNQGISRHGIDLVLAVYSSLSRRFTCSICMVFWMTKVKWLI